MPKRPHVTEYFDPPMCPFGCGGRMHPTDGDAKFVCDYHGVKIEFISEMVYKLRHGTRPDWSLQRARGRASWFDKLTMNGLALHPVGPVLPNRCGPALLRWAPLCLR